MMAGGLDCGEGDDRCLFFKTFYSSDARDYKCSGKHTKLENLTVSAKDLYKKYKISGDATNVKFFTARITQRVSSRVKNCRFPRRVSRISFNSTVVQRLLRK